MTKPFDPHAKDWKDHLARLNLSPIPEPRITPAAVKRLHAALDRAHRRNGGCDCMTTMREIDRWATRENKRTK